MQSIQNIRAIVATSYKQNTVKGMGSSTPIQDKVRRLSVKGNDSIPN
jgi:hypothetical protein